MIDVMWDYLHNLNPFQILELSALVSLVFMCMLAIALYVVKRVSRAKHSRYSLYLRPQNKYGPQKNTTVMARQRYQKHRRLGLYQGKKNESNE